MIVCVGVRSSSVIMATQYHGIKQDTQMEDAVGVRESCLLLKVIRNGHTQIRNVQTQVKSTVGYNLLVKCMLG